MTNDCRHLNESTYKRIENALEGSKAEEKVSENPYFKSLYGPATLINDWLEKRTNVQEEKVSSEPPISEHMDKFRKLCVSTFPDRGDYFNKVFENYGYGQELLLDHLGFSYYGNYVSTYDLCYNHLAKGICGPYPRRYYKGEYKPSTDLSLIYGNLTQWGLKEQVYEKMKAQIEGPEQIISESKAEYVIHDLSEVKKLNDFVSFKRKKVVY